MPNVNTKRPDVMNRRFDDTYILHVNEPRIYTDPTFKVVLTTRALLHSTLIDLFGNKP